MSEQQKIELPTEIRFHIAMQIADKLLHTAAEHMGWSKSQMTAAILQNRINLGTDDKGIYLYVDNKPVAGASMPEISQTSLNDDEKLVFIRCHSLDDIPPITECKDWMETAEA